MATKPNLSDHVSLLFELYNRIPRLSKITASELQMQLTGIGLKRDIRTIQRNLDILVQYLNIDKDSRDKPYGYSRNSLPIKTFGPRESMLLHLAESWLIQGLPAEYKSIIQSTFKEIHNLKTQPNSINKDPKHNFSWVTSNPLVPKSNSKFSTVFEQLSYGVIHRRIVNLTLEDRKLQANPLCLSIHKGKLAVIAYSKENNYQQIEIQKIQEVSLSTLTFEHPENFNPQEFQPKELPHTLGRSSSIYQSQTLNLTND